MTTTLTLETQLTARTDLLATNLSDTELVMMNIDAGKYYGLEDVAKVIWDYLTESRSVGEVCTEVQSRFDIERETAEQDTISFLTELLDEGLVQQQTTVTAQT